MENTIYYSFSTISQTLAAMVALLGVFTIYRLQNLNNKFIDHSQSYLEFLNRMENEKNVNTGVWFTNRELSRLITSKHYKGILELMDREYKKWGDVFSELSGFYKSIIKITSDKQKSIEKTLSITCTSLIIISASIGMLSMATKMNNLTFWVIFSVFLLSIGIVFWQMFQLIKFSLISDL
ncbi:MAG TPA: hypothetical protein VHO50_00190 [Bacteroidales bacterium]|nr:hypothetical protein [Bacteroidales bacterium]